MSTEDFLTGDKSDEEYIRLFEGAIEMQKAIIAKAESAMAGYQDAINEIYKQRSDNAKILEVVNG